MPESPQGSGMLCRNAVRPLTRRLLGCQSGANPVSNFADRDGRMPPVPYRVGERGAVANEAPAFPRAKPEGPPNRRLAAVDSLAGPGDSLIAELLPCYVAVQPLERHPSLDERLNRTAAPLPVPLETGAHRYRVPRPAVGTRAAGGIMTDVAQSGTEPARSISPTIIRTPPGAACGQAVRPSVTTMITSGPGFSALAASHPVPKSVSPPPSRRPSRAFNTRGASSAEASQ